MAYLTDQMAYGQISDGRKVVTNAGTRVQLSSTSVKCKKVEMSAELDNTGIIVVGGSTVVAAAATRRGTPLYAGDTVTIFVDNLNKIYIDAEQDGEGVSFTYYL